MAYYDYGFIFFTTLYELSLLCLCRPTYGQEERTQVRVSFPNFSHFQGSLTNIIIYNEIVYVAGRNILYQLNEALEKEDKLSTGPVLDSPTCLPDDNCSNQVMTDNENKVLLIIKKYNWLLLCGSVKQGICSVHQLNNVSSCRQLDRTNDSRNYLGGKNSVVAYTAPYKGEIAVYIAITYDDRPLYLSPKSVSSRILLMKNNLINFRYATDSSYHSTSIDVHQNFKINFKVKYISGFSYGTYSYFVAVQRQEIKSPDYVSRLIRICKDDIGFYSYTELPLKCRSREVYYNIATAVYLANADRLVAKLLNIDYGDGVLFASFGYSPSNSSFPNAILGSAVCIYSLKEITKRYVEAIRECFSGTRGYQRLRWFFLLSSKCLKWESIRNITDSFCGSAYNFPIQGIDLPDSETEAWTVIDDLITTFTVEQHNNVNVLIGGTQSGTIFKLKLDNKGEKPFLKVPVSQSPIQSLATSTDKKHILFVTSDMVIKFPTRTCSVYLNCSGCVTSGDPLNCGWCNGYCSTQADCIFTGWKNDTCPPMIHKFSPSNGPVAGGTNITIWGENFGSKNLSSIQISVHEKCEIISRQMNRIVCQTGEVDRPIDQSVIIEVVDTSHSEVDYNIGDRSDTDKIHFHFLIPEITAAYPLLGPISGGTLITIHGNHLDIGLSREVIIAEIPCQIFNVSKTKLLCETNRFTTKEDVLTDYGGPISVKIDNDPLYNPDLAFNYTQDPTILSISPQKSFISGGLPIKVRGSNLHTIQKPKLILNFIHMPFSETHNETLYLPCEANKFEDSMICTSISAVHLNLSITSDKPYSCYVSFLMDKVENWSNVNNVFKHHQDMSHFDLYPDPYVFSFDDYYELLHIELAHFYASLTIKGRNLNLVATSEDFSIIVEDYGECSITELKKESISCQIEFHDDEFKNTTFPVKVVVGNLKFELGHIEFLVDRPSKVISYQVMTIVFIISILLLVCICLFFLYLKIKKKGPFRRRAELPSVFYSANPQEDYERPTTSNTHLRKPAKNDYFSTRRDKKSKQSAAKGCEDSVNEETLLLLQKENILIDLKDLQLENIIGQGHFGCVHYGKLTQAGGQVIEVAVKTLNSNSCAAEGFSLEQNFDSFLKEGLMMKDFDHKNVLTLVGVSFNSTGGPMVIIPFMKYGDLLSYIRDEINKPTIRELLTFGVDIAEGMHYLSGLKFVHRDLAARNCMLDENLTVKVADFGLSRDIYERDYYSSGDKKAKLPVKWMAIESLEKGTYNTKTDVWSYGVVLWELMTRGVCPYPDVDNWDVLTYLTNGRRMLQPSYCPQMLYNIMLRCWLVDPQERPSFKELVREVHEVISAMVRAHTSLKEVSLDVTYINMNQKNENSVKNEGYV